ncbi:MAG: TTC39/IML2 family protein [Cytophagales bacterium]|nr:TTC39/IML2 family protein [Cytophagales bacterium]
MACFLTILISKANPAVRLFLLVPFIVSLGHSRAEHISDNALQVAYNQYLDFKFDSCNLSIEMLPESPTAFYLKTLLASTSIFVKDDIDDFKRSKKIEGELLNSLRTLRLNDEYNNFLRAEIKMQWAILKLKNGDEFAAFWNLRQAFAISKENTKAHPDFIPSFKTMGLLHVLFGVLPDKYDWLLSLLGIEGNVELGLSELDRVGRSGHFLAFEANLTLGLLHAYLLNNQAKSVEIIKKIYQKNEHLLLDYAYALILMKNSQSDLALKILEDCLEKNDKPLNIPQLYYLLGEIRLQKSQPDLAIHYYREFLEAHWGKNLIKDTYYKVGICYSMKNDKERASYYFSKSKEFDWAKNEADKYAEISLESDVPISVELMKIRFATDGGFYETALKTLLELDTGRLSEVERCEYYYRSARLYHKTNQVGKAIALYKKTIELQGDNAWYFAPNSALQLGLVFLSKGNNRDAFYYLKLVNSYRDYPYRNSIRQKAKVELKKLD